MAFRAGSTELRHDWSPKVKRLYWGIVGGVVIIVVLTVLFVPGVQGFIQGEVLSRLVGWSQ